MDKEKRESYLDIAKGIGIILVILGHMDIGSSNIWMYSFHLPLFFIVAGICYNPGNDFVTYLKKKARRCLIPYVVFGIIIVLVEAKTGYLYESGFKPNIIRLCLQKRYSTLWFLATLFIASLIFYWIDRLLKQRVILVFVLSCVLSVIFVYLDQNYIKALFWNFDTAIIVLGFMAFGYLIKNCGGILDKIINCKGIKKAGIILSLLVANLAFMILNIIISDTNLEMYWNSYGIYPLMYLAAVCGSLFVIALASSIKFKPLENLGRNSMTYFALHQSVFIWPLTLFFRKIKMITYAPSPKNIISKIIIFVLVIFLCYLIDKLIRSTKLKIILGTE